MAIFGKKKPTTAEEILKAVEDLPEDEKGKFMEHIKAHMDESVAAQAHNAGETDKQSAEDRIDESVGEENALADKGEGKADGDDGNADGDENKGDDGEEVPAVAGEEPATETNDNNYADAIKALEDRIVELETKFEAMQHKPAEADESTAAKLDKLAAKFN
nr:MAG TPA: hypothetical protein [Caudoviricetes sp.]